MGAKNNIIWHIFYYITLIFKDIECYNKDMEEQQDEAEVIQNLEQSKDEDDSEELFACAE